MKDRFQHEVGDEQVSRPAAGSASQAGELARSRIAHTDFFHVMHTILAS
jgi:hypothetical protein